MLRTPVSRWFSRTFMLTISVLAISGVAQMPIFKRYYISDIPGLGWLSDFYFTHQLHYVFSAILLGLIFMVLTRWGLQWRENLRLTTSGMIRMLFVVALVITGLLRMYKNLPNQSLGIWPTLVIDWTHLFLAAGLGIAALVARMRGQRAWAEYK